VYPLRYVSVNVSGCECVALEDSGCQVPIVSERLFAWCCDKVVGKVTLHGFGKSHTVQAPLVNLKGRVSDKNCDEVAEVSLVCAVTELSSNEYDVILPIDVVSKLKATPVTVDVSCCDVRGVYDDGCDMKSETDNVVTGKDKLEEVDEGSVASVKVCVTECNVNDENVNESGSIIMSTPARVSCIVHSVRDEEERTTLFHLKQCRKSSPSLETSSDRVGGCPAHRDEEVRRIQEMADLGPRRTRSRGIQDVTAAGKSVVGPAIRGPRGSGRVRPSVSSTASPGVSVVLVMLCWIFHVARRGTSLADGISCDITICLEDRIFMMYLLLCGIVITHCATTTSLYRGIAHNFQMHD